PSTTLFRSGSVTGSRRSASSPCASVGYTSLSRRYASSAATSSSICDRAAAAFAVPTCWKMFGATSVASTLSTTITTSSSISVRPALDWIRRIGFLLRARRAPRLVPPGPGRGRGRGRGLAPGPFPCPSSPRPRSRARLSTAGLGFGGNGRERERERERSRGHERPHPPFSRRSPTRAAGGSGAASRVEGRGGGGSPTHTRTRGNAPTHTRFSSRSNRHPQHFLHRRHPFRDLPPAVQPQRPHPALEREPAERAGIAAAQQRGAQLVVDRHQLEDSRAAAVAGAAARCAPAAAPHSFERHTVRRHLALGR